MPERERVGGSVAEITAHVETAHYCQGSTMGSVFTVVAGTFRSEEAALFCNLDTSLPLDVQARARKAAEGSDRESCCLNEDLSAGDGLAGEIICMPEDELF